MSQMSKALKRATGKVITLAEVEGFHIVGFVVPKNLEGDDFGWSVFSSCGEPQANELTITIGEILKEVQNTKIIN